VNTLSPAEATARYANATAKTYELVGSLVGGETGATAIREVGEHKRVLKWESDPGNVALRLEALTLAERLRREAHWPVPRQHAIEDDGWLFVSQEFMPGETVTRLTHGLVDEVLSLHDRRMDLDAADESNRWGVEMITILVDGGKGYCLHEPLRTYDERTRRVVEQIEAIGAVLTPADLAGNDIVHADLHTGNLLQLNGQLSAVVDLDYARVGDAAFDLACLAVASLGVDADAGVRKRLFAHGIEALDGARRAAYVGNLLLRNLDWPIRKNRPNEIEFWLQQSDRLLADIEVGR
jgi:thiamine kinase-like enzyme